MKIITWQCIASEKTIFQVDKTDLYTDLYIGFINGSLNLESILVYEVS